jgi:hypothetical protein
MGKLRLTQNLVEKSCWKLLMVWIPSQYQVNLA